MKIHWALIVMLPVVLLSRVVAAQEVDQYGNPIPQGQYQQEQPDPSYQDAPAEPQGPAYGYVGPHPEPYDYGNAPCYQQGAHFHPYPPFDQYLFRQSGGYFYFIGDLGDFGYSQQLWGYQGEHPLPLEYGGGFCYISWPHRHHFAAPPSMPFHYVGGYYTYYGAWDPAYYANRASWNAYYNGYYRSSYYGGRYWTVRPSHIYRTTYGFGAPGVYRPGMTVRTPSGVSVSVGGWGHPGMHGGGRPGAYVAPPPGRPAYVAPPPGRPGAYVAPPPSRPTYVAPPPSRPSYVAPAPARPTYVAPAPSRPAPGPSHVAPPPPDQHHHPH